MIVCIKKYISLAFLLGSFFLAVGMSNLNIQNLNADEFYFEINKAIQPVIIDTRIKADFGHNNIESAILAENPETLKGILDTLDKETPLFFYCDNGARSIVAAKIAQKQGFQKIHNLDEGLIAWKKRNFPLVGE